VSVQERLRTAHVEEVNQWAHEKGRNDRADSDGDAAQETDQNADQIRHDPDIPEFHGTALCQVQGNRIIHGNSQVRRIIECRSKAHRDDSDRQEKNPDSHRRPGHDAFQKSGRKINDVADQEKVDEGSQPDIVPVHEKIRCQENQAEKQVKSSVGKAESELPEKTHGKALERVDAEIRILEKSDADGRQNYPEKGHCDSLCRDARFHFSPSPFPESRCSDHVPDFGTISR